MKLITELTESVSYITEAKEDGTKAHYITGIFMQSETPNKNGRIYPSSVMESAVNAYIDTKVKNRTAYGELGHPQGPQINLDRVSHIITEMKRDGNNFVGKARLTDTPMGSIARGLLESGANLGVSSRGMGTLKARGTLMEVQEDFKLATAADIVADPSAPNAFVRGIMEGVDWSFDEKTGEWIQENRKVIREMSRSQREERAMRLFESFVSKMTKR